MAKLPKIKSLIGQAAKNAVHNAKNNVVHGALSNMGAIGNHISNKITEAEEQRSVKPQSHPKQFAETKETNIQAKPEKTIDGMAHQVQHAVDATIQTVSKGFVFVSKHMENFSNELTKSFEGLYNFIDRLFYRKSKTNTNNVGVSIPENKEKKTDNDDWLGTILKWMRNIFGFVKDILWAKFIKKYGSKLLAGGAKGVSKILKGAGEIAGKAGSKLGGSMLLGKLGGKFIPGLNLGLFAYDLYDAHENNNSALWDYGNAAVSGAFIGGPLGTIGALGLMFAARNFWHKQGNENILSIKKLTLDASDIVFSALNSLEFNKRVHDEGTPSTFLQTLHGGRGQAGFFNMMADRIFGTGQKNLAPNERDGSSSSAKTKQQIKHYESAPDDNTYKGPAKGEYDSRKARANFMQPDRFGPPGSNITSVKTEGGHTFKINKASEEAFKRFIEGAEKAGMPLGNIGGYSPRPGGIAGTGKMSQHSMGNAIDIGSQSARDVISPATRKWIETHPNTWRKLLDETGMISGGDWRHPDLGHIEWSGVKPWENKLQPPQQPYIEQPKDTSTAFPMPQTPSLMRPTPAPIPDLTTPPKPKLDASPQEEPDVSVPAPAKDKISFYQDTLDHRPRTKVKDTTLFAQYFSTANDTEDS
jgi:hypothetical protein